MAITLQRSERDPQRIVDAIIQLTQGRANNVGTATLAVGQTSTIVSFPNCSSACVVLLGGFSDAAMTAAPRVKASNTLNGSFTITHNPAGAGATLLFACVGG